MLIEFSVENYRSFKGKQKLSLTPSKISELTRNICTIGGTVNLEALKSAVIYGANASGKTNLLLAIRKMQEIVVRSASDYQVGEDIYVSPFKLSAKTRNEPCEFEVIFVSDGTRYQYGFSTTNKKIHDEWLFAYPKGRPQRWFIRSWSKENNDYDWYLGPHLVGEKNTWQKSTRDNALFLSTAVQLNSEQLKPVFNWFQKKIKFAGVGGWSEGYSAKRCDDDFKPEIMKFLKAADVGIEDIIVKKEKFNPSELPKEMPDDIKAVVISNMKDTDIYDVSTVHYDDLGHSVNFDLEEESEGTKKLFSLSGPWLDALDKGNILVIDELHSALHPRLVTYLVELFNDPEINRNGAQLVFSTHETSIMNQNIFRRDQIWFCEKNEHNETIVYPLTDYSPRKGRENLEAAYLDGRYGALPKVKKLEV